MQVLAAPLLTCERAIDSPAHHSQLHVDALVSSYLQGLSVAEYERKKEEVADGLVQRVEAHTCQGWQRLLCSEKWGPRAPIAASSAGLQVYKLTLFARRLSAFPGTVSFGGDAQSGGP